MKSTLAAVIILLTTSVIAVVGQDEDVSVEATVSHKQISEEDILQLIISVSATFDPGEPIVVLPPLRDFEKLGEQTSRQFSQINREITYIHRHIFNLRPLRKGTLTIPAIEVEVGDRTRKTESIQVTVSEGRSGDEIIVLQQADKTSVFVGEQILVTTELLFRLRIISYDIAEQPDQEGFVTFEVPLKRVPMDEVEYKGKPYYRFILRQQVMFPVSPGTKELKAPRFQITFRESAYGLGTKIADRSANNLRIEVKSFPTEGQPPGFKGASGIYSIRWWMNSTEGRANEPLTLNVQLTGLGDIERAPEVRPPFPEGFDVISARSRHEASLRNNNWGGSKSWEYILIPSRSGEASIGPLQYTFFNPETQSYETAGAEAIELVIEAPLRAEAPPVTAPSVTESTEWDIRYIKSSGSPLVDQGRSFLREWIFWVLICIPPVANVLLLIGARLFRNRRTETSMRRRRALARAHRRFQRAEKFAGIGKQDRGCEEIKQAILQYFAHKWGKEAGSLSIFDVKAELVRFELHESKQLEELGWILDVCDAPRYSPLKGKESNLTDLIRRAEKALADLDDVL